MGKIGVRISFFPCKRLPNKSMRTFYIFCDKPFRPVDDASSTKSQAFRFLRFHRDGARIPSKRCSHIDMSTKIQCFFFLHQQLFQSSKKDDM